MSKYMDKLAVLSTQESQRSIPERSLTKAMARDGDSVSTAQRIESTSASLVHHTFNHFTMRSDDLKSLFDNEWMKSCESDECRTKTTLANQYVVSGCRKGGEIGEPLKS
ncbi:hypothetical protein KIN20_000445 [Parelaphostrongylus tenuis]|uniref:Uncharacterized protein n=1 Tax=Parelaphostrongylus tenuis TaxID=148309 RepID=A0AAD5LSI0_PARTN|nr:hypothetical protein KIN20_000445 [Parelaphostrongylus tenuis]